MVSLTLPVRPHACTLSAVFVCKLRPLLSHELSRSQMSSASIAGDLSRMGSGFQFGVTHCLIESNENRFERRLPTELVPLSTKLLRLVLHPHQQLFGSGIRHPTSVKNKEHQSIPFGSSLKHEASTRDTNCGLLTNKSRCTFFEKRLTSFFRVVARKCSSDVGYFKTQLLFHVDTIHGTNQSPL